MSRSRIRTWSPRLAITTAVIAAGAVGAPVARADDGSDPGVPSPAGVVAAVADAVGVPGVAPSETPPAVALPASESLPPVSQAADAALQLVSASPGTAPSEAEQPPSASVPVSPAPPPPSVTEPSAQAAPQPASTGDSAVAPDPPAGATPAGESAGDITAAAPTPSAPSEASSPTAAAQLGPVNIQVSIRIASPGDNGAVTQVNAVVAAATGSAAPALDDHTDSPANQAGPRDIGSDITDGATEGASENQIQDPSCDPNDGCCGGSLLGVACQITGNGVLSPQDLAHILDAIFENASANSGVPAQYQGDAVQYRPINVSVSIRIGSPGNDGPIDQVNLVHVQAAISVEVGQVVQPPPGPLDTTVGVASADGVGAAAAPEPVAGEGESGTGALAPADSEAGRTNFPRPAVLDSPFPLSTGPVSRSLGAISLLAWGVGRPPSVAWIAPLGAAATERAETERAAATKPGQRRLTRAAAPTAPPAHPWVPVAFSAAASSAPASGGGSGGGLAIALSLPFVLALLYTGFGRLRTSASVPSAHIDREPERPG